MVSNAEARTTVLVVEDDQTVAELIRAVINDVPGWGAVVAHDAREAQLLLDHVRADVLVVDVMLPGKTGIELLAELRRRSCWDEPPVIVMSANVPVQAVERALGSDPDIQFLPKPFDIDDLLGAVSLAIACGRQGPASERDLPSDREPDQVEDRRRRSAAVRVS
jgi:DNA-binding response OmpR family regulator